MSTAIAEVPATSGSGLPTWLNRLDRGQKTRLGLGLVLFLLIAIAAVMLNRQTDWKVLYANLPDKDGGAIVAQLSQMNIPYRHAEGGGVIMVPADKVHEVRLRLASQGLPKGSAAGFDQLEANRFGMTQFQERLTFQRGLEGELTRSIQALSSVQAARVHLALPNQNGFYREQQKPTASVLLTLHPGRQLDRAQIAGIVHLVASSVPDMSPKAVSVVDDAGTLLSNMSEAGQADAQQLQYVQQLERLYTQRIIDILEPVVGRQNLKAQVTADIDFSQTESTSELHKPNQTPETSTVRSQQVVESSQSGAGSGSNGPTGVPGAMSNQPPANSAAPINAPNTSAGSAATVATTTTNGNTKRESITNYEVDKTVKVVKGASGVVRRLSAAVVINYRNVTEANGKVQAKPLSDQQLEQMTALVREAMGFNKDRGDSVNLMNAQFTQESVTPQELPLWRQPEMQDLARSLAMPVGLLLLGLLVMLGFVRPVLKAANHKKSEPAKSLNTLVEEKLERPPLLPASTTALANAEIPGPSPEQLRLEDARQLAKQNPVAVANIVKTWVNGEAPA